MPTPARSSVVICAPSTKVSLHPENLASAGARQIFGLKIDAEVQFEVWRGLARIIWPGVEVFEAPLETPTGRHLHGKTFSRIIIYPTCRAIFRVVQHRVARTAIVRWPAAISATDQVSRYEQ